jgi:hypothetical protein
MVGWKLLLQLLLPIVSSDVVPFGSLSSYGEQTNLRAGYGAIRSTIKSANSGSSGLHVKAIFRNVQVSRNW